MHSEKFWLKKVELSGQFGILCNDVCDLYSHPVLLG